MKYRTQSYLSIIFFGCLLNNQIIKSISLGSVASYVEKGVEIVGHVAEGVDMAMGIAGVGVALWGSDADKERFNKAAGITSIITSLARGDVQSAQASAEAVRGKPTEPVNYQPLMEQELADAEIVPVQPVMTRSLGDRTALSEKTITLLRDKEKVVTIKDLKIAQFPMAKNQLVFLAEQLPEKANESKLYKLLNKTEILCTATEVQKNNANLIIKVLRGNNAIEIGNVKTSIGQLKKGLFFGTTNGELSVFFKDGDLIKKTVLIKNMNQ